MTDEQANRLWMLQEDIQDAAVAAEQARVRLKKANLEFEAAIYDLQNKKAKGQ